VNGRFLSLMALAVALAGCTSTRTQTPQEQIPAAAPAPPDPAAKARQAATRLELASLYFSKGELRTALAEVNRAIDVKPDYGAAYTLRGLIHAALGDNASADPDFKRALQIDPGDGDTMQAYGWFLCQTQRFAEADQQFQNALAQRNYRTPALALRAMGTCQARDGRLADAERSLTRSYELDPSSAATAVNLAEVLYRRGEYQRARFYIERVNSRPDLSNAQTLWLASRIEYKLGNVPLARGLGDQLRNRYPQSPETLAFEQGRFND
jgi:type IV pilus assembly protein PilF